MPETPGIVFAIFFLVPAIYAIKLGLEVMARLMELLLPIIVIVYVLLLVLVIPKLEYTKFLPIMVGGIKPVLAGALPNINFPFGQILPVAFLYKYVKGNGGGDGKVGKGGNTDFIKYCFAAIIIATILLTFRAMASAAAFDEESLKSLTYAPFSTIRAIEIGNIIERLDYFLLGAFYGTTFFKFIITYYIICEVINDVIGKGKPANYAVPVAILILVLMPFLLPRFDLILKTVNPYLFVSLPIFFMVPLLLYITIGIKEKRNSRGNRGVDG
ncbi:spore germination protein (amino acid permease) [Alkaliphilus hydrothermalis]|uniref:Spore germination protein (Amino acid permease) n=2 Tax=Alkaliphilus hydrothermalis TaxID=1482730 RepID=A0ABS2NRA3_9FIRM|nr:spore germination protein (amino acid permease) [Alkaliphilus hydrothermalis]